MNTLTPNIFELYNVHVTTNHIQNASIEYKVNFSKPWHITPNTTDHTFTNPTPPLLNTLYTYCSLKCNPQQFIHTNGLFMPLNKSRIGNIVGLGVYSLANDLCIIERLPNPQNILRVEIYTISTCSKYHTITTPRLAK